MSDNESEPGDDKLGHTTNIYKVSIKYSPFNRDDPEIWFTQLEAQFEIGGITVDATKYGHLIAALDPDTVKCVRDKILTPPAKNKYTALKSNIIERLSDSAKIKLDRLLSGLQLGDKKPSQLLREMEALSVDQITEPVLRNLWLHRLPTHSQEILSCMEDASLDKLSKAADKILEVHKPAAIYALNSNMSRNSSSSSKNLEAQINELSKRVEELCSSLTSNRPTQPRSRSSSSSKPGSRNKSRQRDASRTQQQVDKHPLCWYHFKFGENARNCLKPCHFKPNQNSEFSENQ